MLLIRGEALSAPLRRDGTDMLLKNKSKKNMNFAAVEICCMQWQIKIAYNI